MRITGDANINFIEDLAFVQDYDYINGQQWMLTKEVMVVNLAPTETKNKETTGFVGRKTTFYRDFVLEQPMEEKWFRETNEVVMREDAYKKDAAFWDSTRGESLSQRERRIYSMVDTIKTIPAYKTWSDLVYLAATGYKETGLFEIGPIYTFLSWNNIEGLRGRFGGQTSNKFSTRLIFSGYVAYGQKDERFKYGGTARYFLSKDPRSLVGAEFKKDVEQLGKSPDAFANDNIFGSILRRRRDTSNIKLNSLVQGKAYIDHEWAPGFSTRLNLAHNIYKPLGDLDYTFYRNAERTDSTGIINNTEATLYLRYARHERFVAGEVDRISLGTNWPIFHLMYSRGLELLEGQFSYNKLRFRMDDYLYPGNFGVFNYIVEAGKVWENLPYPLLFLPPGSNSSVYDRFAFNLMNFYEFACNQYVSFKAEQHFGGIFLDRFPALRKLKWREVATLSAITGHLTDANKELLADQRSINSLRKPYVEAGIGVENIFKFLRVDYIWRLSYLNPSWKKDGPDDPTGFNISRSWFFLSGKVTF
jgi:hypothetical protein